MQTAAAVLTAVNAPLEVRTLELDDPGHQEVLVRYVATGLCHTDLHVMQGAMAHPVPAVLGHEGAGIIEAVGPGVTSLAVGDHVLTSYQPSCGVCRYCTIGRPNLCLERDRPRHVLPDGTARLHDGDQDVYQLYQLGTHAERAVVPANCLVRIRPDAPLDVVCLVSCGVATGAGAVINRAQVRAGDSLVVIGCGGVGLNAVQAGRLVGAGKIIAVDLSPEKLESSRAFGATHTVRADDPERCLAEIRRLTGGGADHAVEAVGTAATISLALHCLHRGGTAVVSGVVPAGTRVEVDPLLLLQERVLTGTSFGSSRQRVDLPMYVDLFMDGRYQLRELISAQYSLADINAGYDALRGGTGLRGVLVY